MIFPVEVFTIFLKARSARLNRQTDSRENLISRDKQGQMAGGIRRSTDGDKSGDNERLCGTTHMYNLIMSALPSLIPHHPVRGESTYIHTYTQIFHIWDNSDV